ncbi:hypothetical protein SAMN05216404_10652 [Nitrosospira multiformis]|uniref:Uncharacterized protein n=2 Tax=Nitrosospira multiformis TaxID=1231 RepID=A0A1H8IE63_9PROT|nr:hypothetical protein SAMN05216404_10652 [Nitrosospira multiformis]
MLMWCRMGIILPMKVESGEEREVLSVPAQEYESGNIALAVDLEPLAKYNILLIGNNEAGDPETLVTIPLEVRRAGDFVHTSKGTGSGFLVMVAWFGAGGFRIIS